VAKDRHTREELREDMRRQANSSRDTADEMALMYGGCDDPLHPWNLNTPWNNWIEFVDMVCRPLVEADGDEAVVQAAMAQYRKACPHYICVALVMAANRAAGIDGSELSADESEPPHLVPNAEAGGDEPVGVPLSGLSRPVQGTRGPTHTAGSDGIECETLEGQHVADDIAGQALARGADE
jgi:hypothetical protein